MSKNLYILFFLFTSIVSRGQYNIAGNVMQKGRSSATLSDVDVYLVERDLLENGNFEFTDIEAGNYTLVIFGLGYNTQEISLNVLRDTILNIFMEPLAGELSEVLIQDHKDELFALKRLRAVEGTAIYAGKKSEVVRIEKMMGNIAANNSRQIYAQVAGLNIYEGNDGGLQLAIGGRGLDPNRTANFNTRQNGYDISADVLGYPESYYTPPAESLDEIQIIRGAASLQYGTQFGGLINFKSHQIPSSKSFELISKQTVGSFGFLNSYNSFGINKGRWTFQTYYNYKKGDGYRENSEFDSHNVFALASYKFSEKTSLKLEYTHFSYLAKQAGGLTDSQFSSNPRRSTRSRNWFNVDWNLLNVLFRHKFSSKDAFSLSVFGLRASRFSLGFRGDPKDLNSNPVTSIDEVNSAGNFVLPRDLIKGKFRNIGAEIRYLRRYKIKNRRSVFLIGSKLYNANNQSSQGPGSLGSGADFEFRNEAFPDYASQSSFDFPNQNIALFSENIFYLNDQFSITPGMRMEYIKTASLGTYNSVIYDIAGNAISNKEFEDNRAFPRRLVLLGLGLSYQPTLVFNAYGNLSQNYRSVTFSDIRTVNPTFIIDPEISDERGFTTDLGVRGRYKDRISYDLGIFSVFYNDRIGIILDERANRVRKNIGNAVIYGLESLIDVQLLPKDSAWKLSCFSNMSLTDSRYTASEENNVLGKKVEFIPRINLKTGFNLGYENFLANIQYTYLSSQFTDVQNSSVPEEGDSREGVIGVIPSYSILDLNVSYKWKQFKVDAGLNNALNSTYFTRRATGYPGPGIIPSDGRSFYFTVGIQL